MSTKQTSEEFRKKRTIWGARTRKYCRLLDKMVEAHPKTFVPRGVLKKPLALGIREMLRNRGTISRGNVQLFLRHYCSGILYFAICVEGIPRLNLDGESDGQVAAAEAEFAITMIRRIDDEKTARALKQKQRRVKRKLTRKC